ncbi:GNAT family N-acetyltransferase [Xylella fastidiosa]|uniref:GNAT family N-acetyltransferase n=2 Tax=Xylella fastidiosa TaxID=2371 RepID=UPI002931E9B8|nr:GNAT family N-acetyltransferase [Xylella fastidiosa]WNY20325.1 GNAT family N-acetyltransferase [Xylella fastidiosa]WNY22616.1 GNAT family N-acetyltransferase [Xylella fastidiosa]
MSMNQHRLFSESFMAATLQFDPVPLTLTEEEWDNWLPEGHLGLTCRFLRCVQQIDISDYSLIPHAVHDGNGNPVGICASYQCTIDSADLGSLRLQNGARALRRFFPNLLRHRTLEIGNPAALGFPLRSPLPAGRSIHALASWTIEKACRERYAFVVIRDIESAAEPETVDALRAKGFFPFPLPPSYLISLPFTSFDEYLAALRTRYRGHYKNCMKNSAQLSVEILDQFDSLSGDLLHLWRNIYERSGKYHRVRLTQAFFSGASSLTESRILLLRRPDRSIAGFALLFMDGPMLRYSCTGFTREAAVGEGVYFRLLYEVVRYGIEHRCQAVNLGVTTPGPKMSVGGRPITLDAWVWHQSPVQRTLIRMLTQTLLRPQPPAIRNPFRDEQPTMRDPALCSHTFPTGTGPTAMCVPSDGKG